MISKNALGYHLYDQTPHIYIMKIMSAMNNILWVYLILLVIGLNIGCLVASSCSIEENLKKRYAHCFPLYD